MGSILGGPAGQNSKQRLPNWARGVADWLFEGTSPGNTPDAGPFADAIRGWGSASPEQLFSGLAGQIPNAQRAGMQTRELAAQGTSQGYGNLMNMASQAWGPVGQTQQIAGLIPQGMDTANYYLQGVTGATRGNNIMGAQGAGQQVVDAALGAPAQFQSEIYNRAVKDATPYLRAASSSRGLGRSGQAARSEQDGVQRITDEFAREAVQARIGALNAAASASGAAASQAIGAQQAALGRGQLGLQASQAPGQIMQQFQNVAQSPLDALTAAAGLQTQPLQLAALGSQLYNQGLQMPLDYQRDVYDFTRAPSMALLQALAGQQQSTSKNDYRGLFGMPKS